MFAQVRKERPWVLSLNIWLGSYSIINAQNSKEAIRTGLPVVMQYSVTPGYSRISCWVPLFDKVFQWDSTTKSASVLLYNHTMKRATKLGGRHGIHFCFKIKCTSMISSHQEVTEIELIYIHKGKTRVEQDAENIKRDPNSAMGSSYYRPV